MRKDYHGQLGLIPIIVGTRDYRGYIGHYVNRKDCIFHHVDIDMYL